MRRVNTFELRPQSTRDRLLLFEVLAASAALWNELTFERRQRFFENRDVFGFDANRLRVRYKGTLGSATAQQLIRKNNEAWRSFFALLESGEDASPPGYWKDDQERILQTLVRNDQYTLEWGERSRLEMPVGFDLKEKYGLGYHERLRLEARGNPRWDGRQGRLEIVYDRDADTFRARQPVSNAVFRRDHTLVTVTSDDAAVAALDIGANNLVAATTSRGTQRLYRGRPAFERFRRTTERIAVLQQALEDDEFLSRRIRELYRRRNERRNHLQDALIRDLANWLAAEGVGEVIVGDLAGVLSEHWSARVNEKTHLFWAHGRFRRRLREVLEGEYGITVREESEAGTSSMCPACGSEHVDRHGDLLLCLTCAFEGHADLMGSENLLSEYVCDAAGPMARPAVSRENTTEKGHHYQHQHRTVPCLEWDDHCWRRQDRATNEDPATQSTHEGNLATGGTGIA